MREIRKRYGDDVDADATAAGGPASVMCRWSRRDRSGPAVCFH